MRELRCPGPQSKSKRVKPKRVPQRELEEVRERDRSRRRHRRDGQVRVPGLQRPMTAMLHGSGLVALADRIELWPVDRLRPYERNPRTHSEEQVDQLAASMVEFGWTNLVLVDEQGGILAGHGRLLAARQLGLAEVPVIRFEHLSEAQKRAYLIADNQLTLNSGWDESLLAEELAWLRDERFDLDLVGFDASELERLLTLADGESESDGAEDEVPEPPEDPVSKPGDLWLLGNHRLLCGDATVLADVERALGGQLRSNRRQRSIPRTASARCRARRTPLEALVRLPRPGAWRRDRDLRRDRGVRHPGQGVPRRAESARAGSRADGPDQQPGRRGVRWRRHLQRAEAPRRRDHGLNRRHCRLNRQHDCHGGRTGHLAANVRNTFPGEALVLFSDQDRFLTAP